MEMSKKEKPVQLRVNSAQIPNNAKSKYWGFNIEDTDPSVVDELPLEIQLEIRGWILKI
jgi:hypothetical protein